MRFMIIVKATPESERGDMPTEPLMAAMARYHEELAQAGVLLDASGLKPTAQGWRVRYGAGGRMVMDGPFTETKELIAGYTLIQVRNRDEALEWTRRFPNPRGEGPTSAVPPNPATADSSVAPAMPADPSYNAGPYKGALTAPPAEAMNKTYPVCTRKIQDSCRNPGGV